MINRILIRIKVVQMLYAYLLTRSEFHIESAPAKKAIATHGISWTYTKEALAAAKKAGTGDMPSVLKVSTPFPFPEKLAVDFLRGKVPDGEEALAYLDAADYDVAVLDIMMPKVDGLTVLRTLRGRDEQLPVLLLTARDAVADRVDGLDAGADDYLIKPFALDELLARLRVLTRKKGSGRTNVYTLADLTVDTAGRTAQRNGRTLELSAREYALLEYLMRNKGVILSRQHIENNLWSLDYAGGTNVVDVYISYLRKKLELPGEARLLHTVRGMGWVLKEDA